MFPIVSRSRPLRVVAVSVCVFLMSVSAVSAGGSAAPDVIGAGPAGIELRPVPRALKTDFRGDAASVYALRAGAARAVSIASADFDADGAPDLVTGYEYNGTGIITIQRGNTDAYAPTDDSVFLRMHNEGYNPEPLEPTADSYAVPQSPDILKVGDFDHDNHPDVLVAKLGGDLYLLSGDATGELAAPQRIDLGGLVTAVAAGQFRAPDGQTDVAVGIDGAAGPEVVAFDGVAGIVGEAIRFRMAATVTGLEAGSFDADSYFDIAAAAGDAVEIIHGWGRKQNANPASRVERIGLDAPASDIAAGFFIWNRGANSQIAVRSEDGTVSILDRSDADTRPDTTIHKRGSDQIQQKRATKPVDVETLRSWPQVGLVKWAPVKAFASTPTSNGTIFQRSHLSFGETDDILFSNPGDGHLVSVRQEENTDAMRAASVDVLSQSIANVDSPTAFVALHPKLNGERDFIVASKGGLTLVPVAPTATITVDRTDDPAVTTAGSGAAACTAGANDCSLRGAVLFANATPGTTISLGSNTYQLTIAGDANDRDFISFNPLIGDLNANATNTTITGSGSGVTTVQQTTFDRILVANATSASNIVQSFSGIKFTGGRYNEIGKNIGGAGFFTGGPSNDTTWSNCLFVNNVLSRNPNQGSLGGGAFVNTGGDVHVTNDTFGGNGVTDPNVSITSGGAISYDSSDFIHNSLVGTMTVGGSTFIKNSASGGSGGGAITMSNSNLSSATVNIGTSTFTSNTTTGSGGAIILQTGQLNIASSSFNTNNATNAGGAIHAGGGPGMLLDGTSGSVTFTGNTSGPNLGTSISLSSGNVNVSGTQVSIGGSVLISGNSGSWTNNTGSTLAPTDFFVLGGVFNGNNSTMDMAGDLKIGPSGNGLVPGTFNASSSTINIAGNFDFDSTAGSALNAGTGTFIFDGTSTQSITNNASITFNNLTDSNTTQPLTANNSFAVGGSLNVNGANAIFNPVTGAVISGGGTLTGSGTARVTRTAATPDFSSQYTITNKTLTNLTVEYIGTSAQTLSTITYGPLKINNGNGVGLASGTATVNGLLTLTAGALGVGNQTLVINGNSSVGGGSITSNPTGTVNYNQSSVGQAVRAFNYGNLTFSNFNKVLEPAGTIGVSGVFTPGTANGHTITGSTININGTGAQTVPAFNYNNLTISGSRGANNVTLANGGSIGIGGTFSPAATFAGGNYVVANNTVDFNGSGSQTIPAFNYFNLTSSNAGARTLASSGTIGIASVFSPGTNSYTISGSTVAYNGTSVQTLPSSFPTYFNLTLNNVAGVTGFTGLTVQQLVRVQAGTFTSSSTFNNVQIDAGATLAGTNATTINVSGSWTNNGTFTSNGNTVNFNGSSAQTIGGSSVTAFDNLSINNAAGVSLGQNCTVNGALTVTNGAFTTGANQLTLNAGATASGGTIGGNVIYNQSSDGQTVLPGTYSSLTFSNFKKVLSPTGTIVLTGTFTPGSATGHTITGSTVEYAGSALQTLPSAFTAYNNLTLNNANGTTGFAGLTVNGLLRVAAGTFTSSSSYNNVQVDAGATLAGVNATTINMAGNWTNNGTFTSNGNAVNFNGAAGQSIGGTGTNAFNNLTIANSNGVTMSGNVTVNGTLTLASGALAVGTNTLTINSATSVSGGSLTSAPTGTVNYSQSSTGQGVIAASYGNLVFSNFNKILPAAVIGVGGTFTPGTATGHTISGSTIDFSNTGAQTIPAFNYNNLTNTGGGPRTLDSTGTVGVSGTFAPGGGTYTIAGSTVNFNGSGPQTIPAFAYNNLVSSSTGARTLASSGSVGVAGAFTPGANAYTTTGSTVVFNGSSPQTIPSFTFSSVSVNNPAGATLGGNVSVGGNFDLTNGNLTTAGNTFTVLSGGTTSRTAGQVIGAITKNFVSGLRPGGIKAALTAFIFPVGTASGFYPLTVTPTAGSTGSLTVQVFDGNKSPLVQANTMQRYWTMSSTGTMQADLLFDFAVAGGPTTLNGNTANYQTTRVSSGGQVARFPNNCATGACFDLANRRITIKGSTFFTGSYTAGDPAGTTAAYVNVSGRVTNANGSAIRNARVTLDDGSGHTVTATTNTFGYYVAEVEAGRTYMLNAASRGFIFTPRAIVVTDTLSDVDMTALP